MSDIPCVTHDEVAEWPVDRVHAFVCLPTSRQVPPARDFNWDLFSSMMEINFSESHRANSELASMWAEIIIRIDDELGKLYSATSPLYSDGFENRAMYLRCWLILRHGPREGDHYRDPHFLEQWFIKRLPTMDSNQPLNEQLVEWLAAQRRVEVLLPLRDAGVLSEAFPLEEWAAKISHSITALSVSLN